MKRRWTKKKACGIEEEGERKGGTMEEGSIKQQKQHASGREAKLYARKGFNGSGRFIVVIISSARGIRLMR
jgi:hypothetical protein